METLLYRILLLALVVWILGYLQYAFLYQVSESVSIQLRTRYLRSLLRQEVAYFELLHLDSMADDIDQ